MTSFLIKHHQALLDAMMVLGAVGAVGCLQYLFPFWTRLFPLWTQLFPFWLLAATAAAACLVAVPAVYGMVKAEQAERNHHS